MQRPSILIVDQRLTVGERVRQLLAQDGYSVQAYESSQVAVKAAKDIAPQLLIVNPLMPQLSGVEAARQISRASHCKVLFLTEMAKDGDFREVLRGLQEQGVECSALGVPLDETELVAFVRRELGHHDLTGTDSEAPQNSRTGAAAAPARAAIADYKPLLEMVTPRLYERNAFRITGLPVNASLRDISKQVEKLEMMAKLGVPSVGSPGILASSATIEEIRDALQSLKNPETRLLHEFFWFWPICSTIDQDDALGALKGGDLSQAEAIWKSIADDQRGLSSVAARLDSDCPTPERQNLEHQKLSFEHAIAVATHNLAVLSHYHAISISEAEPNQQNVPRLKQAWETSFKFWSTLTKRHAFWDALAERIRKIDDPRLGVGVAEAVWSTLPVALLSVNADYAVQEAEARRFESAGLHRQMMKESGFPIALVREALARSLKPLHDELACLCAAADKESDEKPTSGAQIVLRFFEDKKRYLQCFNYLLGAGDPLRDSANDLVAQTARGILVDFANKTEDWTTAQPLFEECLALATSKSLRSRLEDDLEMLAKNAAGKAAADRAHATPPSSPQPAARNDQRKVPSAAAPTAKKGLPAWALVLMWVGIGALVLMFTFSNQSTPSGTATPQPTYEAPGSGSYPVDSRYQDLRNTIERNKASLREMEQTLTSLNEQFSRLESQIEADKASLTEMKEQHNLGLDVDADRYEQIRQHHNSTLLKAKKLAKQYEQTRSAHETLLIITNSQIDDYNNLVKNR
jgi:DNA-binding response OmpR family regulator